MAEVWTQPPAGRAVEDAYPDVAGIEGLAASWRRLRGHRGLEETLDPFSFNIWHPGAFPLMATGVLEDVPSTAMVELVGLLQRTAAWAVRGASTTEGSPEDTALAAYLLFHFVRLPSPGLLRSAPTTAVRVAAVLCIAPDVVLEKACALREGICIEVGEQYLIPSADETAALVSWAESIEREDERGARPPVGEGSTEPLAVQVVEHGHRLFSSFRDLVSTIQRWEAAGSPTAALEEGPGRAGGVPKEAWALWGSVLRSKRNFDETITHGGPTAAEQDLLTLAEAMVSLMGFYGPPGGVLEGVREAMVAAMKDTLGTLSWVRNGKSWASSEVAERWRRVVAGLADQWRQIRREAVQVAPSLDLAVLTTSVLDFLGEDDRPEAGPVGIAALPHIDDLVEPTDAGVMVGVVGEPLFDRGINLLGRALRWYDEGCPVGSESDEDRVCAGFLVERLKLGPERLTSDEQDFVALLLMTDPDEVIELADSLGLPPDAEPEAPTAEDLEDWMKAHKGPLPPLPAEAGLEPEEVPCAADVAPEPGGEARP